MERDPFRLKVLKLDCFVYSNIKDSEENTRMSIRSAWRESSVAMKAVLKVPTFQVIILQGLFGTLAGVAQVFFTMWLELIGAQFKPSLFVSSISRIYFFSQT
jgi:hypothetical protein